MMMLIALAAAAVQVPSAPDFQRIEVSYADLDLSRASDRRELNQRLRLAAQQICDPDGAISNFYPYAVDRCVAETFDRTRPARIKAVAMASSRQEARADIGVSRDRP